MNAPRQLARPRGRGRRAVLLVTLLAVALLVPGVALAHGGIVPLPVVDRLPDGLEGLEAEGVVAYAPRLRVTNPDDEPLAVIDASGVPWLRLSSDGVFADLSVRAWYESLDPSGRGIDVPADAPEGWTQVSVLPTWEFYDTELLPRTTSDEEHRWSVPVAVEGRFDEIGGVLEESELQGRWTTDLLADGELNGARLTAVSGPVPVFIVQRLQAEEVVVEGRLGEPMVRLTDAGFEVNLASPSWNDQARLDPQTEIAEVVEDPDAEPVWSMHREGAPVATWVDVRGTRGTPVPLDRDATQLDVTLPITVDGEPFDVPVRTQWVGDEVPLFSFRLSLPALVAASLGAGLLAAGAVRLWERRREGGDADDDGTTTPGDEHPADDEVARTRR